MRCVWRATEELATSLRGAEDVGILARDWPGWRTSDWTPEGRALNSVFAGFGGLEAQPLALDWGLQRTGMWTQVTRSSEGQRFRKASERLSHASALLVEWLRSRLPGYPRMLVPHVDVVGPFSDR
ncbi:hypothetical protein ACFL6C_10670, partial [Myxococcota bacterium]